MGNDNFEKLSSSTTTLDNLALEEAGQLRRRKTWMWRISLVVICLVVILLIGLIVSCFCISLFCCRHTVDNLGKYWHIYLINIFACGLMLSGFLTINRLTWKDSKSKDEEGTYVNSSVIDMFIQGVIKATGSK